MDDGYYRINVACDNMEFEIIIHSLPQCSPLQLAFLGDVACACTNIQQVAEYEEGQHK